MKRKVFIGLVFVAILALTCASAALAQTTDEPAAHVGFSTGVYSLPTPAQQLPLLQ